MKVGDLVKLLEGDGWRLARTKGVHRQYKHPSKPGTLGGALRQAGLKK